MDILYVRQLNNGEQSGDEVPIAFHYLGQSAVELLDLKEASARDGGWGVWRTSATSMHAWKQYVGSRKDRYFEIRSS